MGIPNGGRRRIEGGLEKAAIHSPRIYVPVQTGFSLRRNDLTAFFDSRTMERAKRYQENGYVGNLRVEEQGLIEADVQGSTPWSYEVSILVARVDTE